MHFHHRFIIAASLVGCSACAGAADLTGTTVKAEWLFPDIATPIATDMLTVGAGPEIDCPGPGSFCAAWGSTDVQYDIAAHTISFLALEATGHASASFNGYRFSGLDAGGAWSGASLTSNIAGLNNTRLSFDGSSLWLDMKGLLVPANGQWTVTLASAVPESSTASLTVLGLAVLVAAARTGMSSRR